MLSTDSSFPVVDFRELASAQVGDPELDKLHVLIPLFVLSKFLWLSQEECPSPATHPQAACDTSTGNLRPYVPQSYRRHVFNILHSMSHPGICNKQRLVTSHFVWPSINGDARRWACSCLHCQRAKVHKHTATPLAMLATPDARFDHVHIDFVGPLPPSNGPVDLRGLRLSPSQIVLLIQLPRPSSKLGSLGLEYPQPSPLTVADSLNPICGRLSLTYWSQSTPGQ